MVLLRKVVCWGIEGPTVYTSGTSHPLGSFGITKPFDISLASAAYDDGVSITYASEAPPK